MEKVSEKVDLSRKVLEIDIESPIFNCMLHDLNKEIKRVIDKVYDEEFEAGEITLKLVLTIPEAYKEFPRERLDQVKWLVRHTDIEDHTLNIK